MKTLILGVLLALGMASAAQAGTITYYIEGSVSGTPSGLPSFDTSDTVRFAITLDPWANSTSLVRPINQVIGQYSSGESVFGLAGATLTIEDAPTAFSDDRIIIEANLTGTAVDGFSPAALYIYMNLTGDSFSINQVHGSPVPNLQTILANMYFATWQVEYSGRFVGGNIENITQTPIPAALPLFASALGGLGFFAWRRRKPA
jgi:hypothetical protein